MPGLGLAIEATRIDPALLGVRGSLLETGGEGPQARAIQGTGESRNEVIAHRTRCQRYAVIERTQGGAAQGAALVEPEVQAPALVHRPALGQAQRVEQPRAILRELLVQAGLQLCTTPGLRAHAEARRVRFQRRTLRVFVVRIEGGVGAPAVVDSQQAAGREITAFTAATEVEVLAG